MTDVIANPPALLACDRIAVSYGAIQALRGVSLRLGAGRILALLGANGAGKSTLLRSISGIVPVRSGTVTFDGQPITGLDPRRIVALGIAHCPEGRRLFGSLTVAENLRLGASVRSDRDAVDADRVRLFELFPVLRDRIDQPAGTLSGGEQQQLALARALMARPRVLLLDEPSLGVAPRLVAHIFETLAELRRRGVSILLVEQNVRAALKLADDAIVLASGAVRFSDDAAALSGATLESSMFGSAASAP